MGTYTIRGSKRLDDHINSDLQKIVDALMIMPEANEWGTVVLMGGYGRGEGTPFIKDGQEYPYNDYDLILVSRKGMSFLKRTKLQKKLHQKEQELTKQLSIHVDLFLHTPKTLKTAESSLMNYELKYGHRIIYGDESLLRLSLPDYTLSEVSLSEGTRLLLNRGILLLFNQLSLKNKSSWGVEEEQQFLKYIMKVNLALGDALLLALGHYDLSYVEKKERAKSIEDNMQIPNFAKIRDHYLQAIEFKEWADFTFFPKYKDEEILSDAISIFYDFFLWYESARLGIKILTLEKYVESIAEDKECSKWSLKKIGMNFALFKHKSLKPSMRWLSIYPRNRLFPALLLLLKRKRSDEEISLLRDLIGKECDCEIQKSEGRGHVCEKCEIGQFVKLWEHLS